MIQEIKTAEDVKTFFNELYTEGLSFHPDDLFEDYVRTKTGEPFYSVEEVAVRNVLMGQAFDVCEKGNVDIYELSLDTFMKDFHSAFSFSGLVHFEG